MGRGRARSQGSLPGRHTMSPYITIQRNATPTTCTSLLAKFDGEPTTVRRSLRQALIGMILQRVVKRMSKKHRRAHQQDHHETQQRKRTRTRQRRALLLMPMDASSASDKKRKVIEGESSPRGLKRMRFG